ncbi:DUF1281 family ferredoxin-like fold protein [Halomonas sp. E19]|uniref:DUF1281 family ferredoxin-like fold protein n=1 Tax=Halomonas sp. E19 TaxID=3397247 RepID=UPI0040337A03
MTTREELQAFLDKLSPDYRHQADQAKAAEDATGARSWYHWRLNHWNTKWNAVGPRITDKSDTSVIIKFDAADSVPIPIFSALAVRFPDLEFKGEFLEECLNFQGTFEKTPDGVSFKIEEVEFDFNEVETSILPSDE